MFLFCNGHNSHDFSSYFSITMLSLPNRCSVPQTVGFYFTMKTEMMMMMTTMTILLIATDDINIKDRTWLHPSLRPTMKTSRTVFQIRAFLSSYLSPLRSWFSSSFIFIVICLLPHYQHQSDNIDNHHRQCRRRFVVWLGTFLEVLKIWCHGASKDFPAASFHLYLYCNSLCTIIIKILIHYFSFSVVRAIKTKVEIHHGRVVFRRIYSWWSKSSEKL